MFKQMLLYMAFLGLSHGRSLRRKLVLDLYRHFVLYEIT